MFQQRICQRERACGEEAGVPEAPEAAADRERADWVPGVDLQSRLASSVERREVGPQHLCQKNQKKLTERSTSCLSLTAEEVLLEEEDEIAEEKSPLDGAWYKRTQNLSGKKVSFFVLLFVCFFNPGMSTGRKEKQACRAEIHHVLS